MIDSPVAGPALSLGGVVRMRGCLWRDDRVEGDVFAATPLDGRDATSRRFSALLEQFEPDTTPYPDPSSSVGSPADQRLLLEAYRLSLVHGTAPILGLQRSRAVPTEYQLVPLQKSLAQVRMLIADGVGTGKTLQPQVRRALTALLNGVLTGTPQLRARLREQPAFGREIYRKMLTVLYRILFLLFAEQRGLLDGARTRYGESYSVSRLRDLAERRTPEPRRGNLWEGLKATFSGQEAFADALGVYPYDGELFDLDRTPHLSAAGYPNSALLDAVRAMTTITLGQVRQYVDFRHLGVEELGTVHESPLGYTIRVADAAITVDGEAYGVGQACLAPLSTERAELGAYYTPSKLVDVVLSRSLDPLIADRLEAAGTDPAARERAFLDLRIIDPACGSAAFLVAVIDRLAVELAGIRGGQRQPNDYDVQIARREVLEHCIYAIDADPFAVELAKVALWIHCAVRDTPLNFLDHKVVRGDSLVGWPLAALPRGIPDKAYDPPSWTKGDARRFYQHAASLVASESACMKAVRTSGRRRMATGMPMPIWDVSTTMRGPRSRRSDPGGSSW